METYRVVAGSRNLNLTASSVQRAAMEAHFILGQESNLDQIFIEEKEVSGECGEFLCGFNDHELTSAIHLVLERASEISTGSLSRDMKIKALWFFMENTQSIGFPSVRGSQKEFVSVNGISMIPDEVLYWAWSLTKGLVPDYKREMVLGMLKYHGAHFNGFVAKHVNSLSWGF